MSVHQSLRERAWSLFFSLHIRRSSGLWSLCSWLHWLPEKVSKQLCKYKLYFQGPNPLVFGWESFIKIMVKFSRSIFLFIQCCWRCVGTSNPLLPLCKIEMNSELVWSYVVFFLHVQNLQVFVHTPCVLFKKILVDDCQILFWSGGRAEVCFRDILSGLRNTRILRTASC